MQQELFEMSGPVVEAGKLSGSNKGWLDRFQVTIRVDHLFILAISALVFYVLVFSFGVEKGKRFVHEELKAEKAKREQMAREVAVLKQEPSPKEEVQPIRAEVTLSVPESKPAVPSDEPSAGLSSKPIGKYTIQLVTYNSLSRAEKEAERLTQLGYRGFVISSGKFHQVCVEGFENIREAGNQLARLQQEGFAPPDAYIRPLALNTP